MPETPEMPELLAQSDHRPMSEKELKDLQFRVNGLLVLSGDSPEVKEYFEQMAADLQRLLSECRMLRVLIPLEFQIDAMALARKEVQRERWEREAKAAAANCKTFLKTLAGKNLRGVTVEQLYQQLDDWMD